MDNKETDTINLGSSIQLSGFRDLDGGKMVILKKIIGNSVKKISERAEKFENIELVMKPIGDENSGKYEVHAKLVDNGKVITAKETDRNMFIVVNNVLTKIFNEISRE
jgi:ribosome-associated translation inhibitor RaiA